MALVDYDSDDDIAKVAAETVQAFAVPHAQDVSECNAPCGCTVADSLKFLPVQGDWPCLLFVDVLASRVMRAACFNLVQHIADAVNAPFRLLENGHGFWHLSLSRPFVLRHEQLQPFAESLRTAFRSLRRVTLSLGSPALFVNDQRTRTFAGALIEGEACRTVASWIAAADTCLSAWNKPAFYTPSIPHISLADTPGDLSHRVHTEHMMMMGEVHLLPVHKAEEGQKAVAGYRTAVDALLGSTSASSVLPGSYCSGTAGAARAGFASDVPTHAQEGGHKCGVCGGWKAGHGEGERAEAGPDDAAVIRPSTSSTSSRPPRHIDPATLSWPVTEVVFKAGHLTWKVPLGQ